MGSFSEMTGNAVAFAPTYRAFDRHDLSFHFDLESRLMSTVSRNRNIERNIGQTFHFIVQDICSALWITSTLGLHRVYYAQWRLSDRDTHLGMQPMNAVPVFAIQIQWESIVERMVTIWKSVWVGCALLLPLSVTFLQVEGVLENVFTRTTSLSSVILSSAGLVSSAIYVSGKVKFTSRKIRNKWKEASPYPISADSVEFWACLSLPLSFLLWSALYSVSTILIISWTKGSGASVDTLESHPDVGFLASALFLTAQILIVITQFYRALKFLTST